MVINRKAASLWRWARNTMHFYGLLLEPGRKEAPAAGRPPVVLIHSWGSTRGSMNILSSRLASDGFAIAIADLGGLAGLFNTNGIEKSAERLAEQIEPLAAASPHGRVALVGHSIGGVIGRWLIAALGGSRYVHTLVTLGSPHRGTPAASSAMTTPGRWVSQGLRDIAPHSGVIMRLNSLPIPQDVYVSAIFSRSDNYCPRPCAELDIPGDTMHLRNIDAGDYGHVELVVDPAVYAIVRQELTAGLTRAEDIYLRRTVDS
ncbi:MAG: alpha/beta fold hydrolase [bacterium]